MPTPEVLLQGLKEIANQWKALGVIWHVYFGAIVVALLAGIRPSRRPAGLALGLPLLSVSALAWISSNPFNGIVFGLIGLLAVYFSVKLPCEPVRTGPPLMMIPGIILFVFGWVYPHFLDAPSLLPYLYSLSSCGLPRSGSPRSRLSIFEGQ